MTQRNTTDPATGLQVLSKQPGDTNQFLMDFGNKLGAATVASVSSVTATAQGDVVGAVAVTASNTAASAQYAAFSLSGGTSGERYKITATVVDSNGNILEGDGMLYVDDT